VRPETQRYISDLNAKVKEQEEHITRLVERIGEKNDQIADLKAENEVITGSRILRLPDNATYEDYLVLKEFMEWFRDGIIAAERSRILKGLKGIDPEWWIVSREDVVSLVSGDSDDA
jgi:uncharacterized coiled-coil DUF342 family protein